MNRLVKNDNQKTDTIFCLWFFSEMRQPTGPVFDVFCWFNSNQTSCGLYGHFNRPYSQEWGPIRDKLFSWTSPFVWWKLIIDKALTLRPNRNICIFLRLISFWLGWTSLQKLWNLKRGQSTVNLNLQLIWRWVDQEQTSVMTLFTEDGYRGGNPWVIVGFLFW